MQCDGSAVIDQYYWLLACSHLDLLAVAPVFYHEL